MPRQPKRPEIDGLYYITHFANMPSILSQGILSHQYVQEHSIPYTPIYDAQIVSNRGHKKTPDGRSLWEFANLYFQPRNPMLFRVLIERDPGNIAVVRVRPSALQIQGAYITDGNAASAPTVFGGLNDGLERIAIDWKTIKSEWWNSVDGSKRKIMAECLVPTRVPPDLVDTICVVNHDAASKLKAEADTGNLPVIPEPTLFFRPARVHQITHHLRLAEGDMFFSRCQTLTVSVNTVGIMGKGLASRAKYQFPDVYVVYQDACRNRRLKMGTPYLYKRESALDDELTEDPHTLKETPNGIKWFLLFATKRHWRENSNLAGIEEGLRWIVDNYKREGITSMALPALGCGLGNLDWKDVGPIMCHYLAKLDVPVTIYLPREREIGKEFVSSGFLLPH